MRAARILLPLLCTAALALSSAATAQVLYKWIDVDGRTHFSDKRPVGFKGEVTVIQPDAMPDPVIRRPAAPAKAPVAEEEKERPNDMAAKRRALREQLAARVAQARERLEAAKKAASDGEDAGEGERQFVRQNFPRGPRNPPPRQNCFSTTASDGKAIWNCPRQVPTEGYFDRREAQEEAIRKAEEELVEAERAYRRGVD